MWPGMRQLPWYYRNSIKRNQDDCTQCAQFSVYFYETLERKDWLIANGTHSVIQPPWGSCVFEVDYDMLAVVFGRRNMVSSEELALSIPLSSGLVLSAEFRWMVCSVLIRIVHI